MKISSRVVRVALAASFAASAGSAATVTATFDGNTFFGDGPFQGTAGTEHTLEIVGRDDVVGTPAASIPEFFAIGMGSATAYSLSSMRYALPNAGRSFTSTNVTGYVGNNVTRFGSGNTVDGIAVFASFSQGGVQGTLRYFAEFDAGTWSDDSSRDAVIAALTTADTLGRGAGVRLPDGSASGVITIRNVVVVQDPPPPPPPSGGGGTVGGGGGTPAPAPVPLPAGFPLLLAGLGTIGYLKFKR